MLDLTILLAKAETVPGTAVVPTAAADAFIVSNYTITPMESQEVRRAIDLPFPGRRPSIDTATHARHSFDFEMCGSGAALTAAKWGQLLRACMFSTPTVGASDVTYGLNSSGDGDALSLYGYKDVLRHRNFNVRGNAKFSLVEKGLPKCSLDLMGLYTGLPVDSAAPGVPTFPVYPPPLEVNLANTVITLAGNVLGLRSLEIDMGMKTTFYSTTGGRSIIFDKSEDGDRRSAGGTAVFEMIDPATYNFFTAINAGTPLAFSAVHGTAAGNILDISSPGFVPRKATYSAENNRMFMNLPFDLIPTAAGTELVVKTR